MVNALTFIRQPTGLAQKASDTLAPTDWRYETHVKKLSQFYTCAVTVFLRAGNLCKTQQFI